MNEELKERATKAALVPFFLQLLLWGLVCLLLPSLDNNGGAWTLIPIIICAIFGIVCSIVVYIVARAVFIAHGTSKKVRVWTNVLAGCLIPVVLLLFVL